MSKQSQQPTPTPVDLDTIRTVLHAYRIENYRRGRWIAINNARKAGLTWQEIADELGVLRPSVQRTWTLGPEKTEGE